MSVFDSLKEKFELVSALAKGFYSQRATQPDPARLPADAKYKIGETIRPSACGIPFGDFTVLDVKFGGYALVYIVVVERTREFYALRTFQDWRIERPDTFERAASEAETWLRLGKHPHIVYADAVFNMHGRPHILLEYVVGKSLRDKIKRGPLSVRSALKYAVQFCRGMMHAQERVPGFTHRDIKPSNCMITSDDVLKITDFGHARIAGDSDEAARTGARPYEGRTQDSGAREDSRARPKLWGGGTPAYMSPEQFDAHSIVDARSDVYSFGVTLFEMLTARRPFKGVDRQECFEQHKNVAPPDPATLNERTPEALAELTLRCLAKLPEDRPQSFAALEMELSELSRDVCGKRFPLLAAPEPTYDELLKRGESLLSLGFRGEALERAEEILKARSNNARAWTLKADALERLERNEEALVCYERALEADARYIFALSGKGRTLEKIERLEEALHFYERALALDARLAFVYEMKGRTLNSLGRCQEALRCIDRALSLDARNSETHKTLALVYTALNRFDEAEKAYAEALRLETRKS